MTNSINAFESWLQLDSVPYYFFYYYVPVRVAYPSDESIKVREAVWSFKDGIQQDKFIDILEKKIGCSFERPDLLTLVCIPASTSHTNTKRFESFSNKLCGRLGMINGFQHVSILTEKTPSHRGGNEVSTYEFDSSFFQGKKVVLFDDVVTRGTSMSRFINYMNSLGAEVVCCISLCLTFYGLKMSNDVSNPWTGNAVLTLGSQRAPDPDNDDPDNDEGLL
ncbi:phosphoribosyltransferase [Anaerobiospirillum sp. NML120449]|uniref:phosphoribosyltransferase n=1 Tax=Anaerobiospirillum sp. NML120449 TaxID=2932817 RepID=UPI001FF68936|nr:phosphoribosyltransferase [Anaerobiospirillum sp. NML120449]MCK0527346.1 phosphoribosyltransferase [Anaerobiospirillum sp. NML120449]